MHDDKMTPSVQFSSSEPPKPEPRRRKKIVIIAVAAAVLLLGVVAAIAAIFFPRDALIFFMGEERYTRTMFSGVAEGVSELLLDQFKGMFEDGIDMDAGEIMYSLSFEAEPGAVRRLANDFAFFDDNTINTLELIAASSLNFSATYDISGQSPVMSQVVSWNVTGADRSTEEILSLESLTVDNTIYLRVQQLFSRYIGINLGDLGLDLSDIGDFSGAFSNLFEQYNIELFGFNPDNIEQLADFVYDNEREISQMISTLVGAFFSSLDDMRVDRNALVSIGNEMRIENIHRAVITADYEDVLLASMDVLEAIRENDEYTSLIFDALWIIDPRFDFTRREFLDYLDELIETLEDEAESARDSGEYVDFYMYINRRNRISGFGITSLNSDDILSFVVINNMGYNLEARFDSTYLNLYGFLDNVRQGIMGDVHIFFRHTDLRSGNVKLVEGKLLDFQHNSDMITILVDGNDILGLIDDELMPDAQTADLLENLELTLAMRFSDRESGVTLDIRLARPEISFTLLSRFMPLDDDYIFIAAPESADVLYLDLPALMTGNMFALLPHLGVIMEIYNNFYDVAESLDSMGFDIGRILEGFLDNLFGGLF